MSPEIKRLAIAAIHGLIGLWFAYALVTSRDVEAFPMSEPLIALVGAGAALLPPLAYLSGVPARMAARYAEFWGGGGLTRTAVSISVSITIAFVWAGGLMFLFGT